MPGEGAGASCLSRSGRAITSTNAMASPRTTDPPIRASAAPHLFIDMARLFLLPGGVIRLCIMRRPTLAGNSNVRSRAQSVSGGFYGGLIKTHLGEPIRWLTTMPEATHRSTAAGASF